MNKLKLARFLARVCHRCSECPFIDCMLTTHLECHEVEAKHWLIILNNQSSSCNTCIHKPVCKQTDMLMCEHYKES